MLAFIEGEIVSAKNGVIVLENKGIGYELNVSNATIAKSNLSDKRIRLHTYLHMREDSVTLYGFHSQEEKYMFLKLITISGVGPKVAMSILSGIELSMLVTAIVTQDIKTLSSVKGIGKKTAERIVLELKESISLETKDIEDAGVILEDQDRDTADAVLALRGLGISQKDAVRAVQKAKGQAKGIEDLIEKALKNI
ncbi:MAG: Holliday junction branch migration protein RuvA [Bacillota bacterium]|nr:Holliday junction branch migration protein RuvA [Bacillota bacterium]HHU43134.1 Holliday junction branch migration protein RuvA [Clostridiales bacterium]